MALELLWWGKLEDGTDEIAGRDLTANGSPQFTACKFNNGVKGVPSGVGSLFRGALLSQLYANTAKGACSFWIKTPVSYASGTPIVIWTGETNPRFLFVTANEQLEFYGGGAHSYVAALNLSANTLYHVCLAWKNDQFSDGNAIKVYVNDTATLNSATTWTATAWGTGNFSTNSAEVSYGASYVSDAIIDNLKFWGISDLNDVLAIVANKETENYSGVTGPTITTTTLDGACAGTAYSDTVEATGGTAPYAWSISAGALPTGLSIAAGTGVISGTPSGTSGAYAFTAKVIDAASQSDTASLSITLANPPTITTTTLDDAPILGAYTKTLVATGDTPMTWNISAGSLPTGLSLAGATGIISGTPTALGTSSFTARAVNACGSDTQALILTIVANPPTITTTTLANAEKNNAYRAQLSATSAVGASTFTWALSSGSLPTGLSLSSAGLIYGTPTTLGDTTSSFTVSATDAGGTDTQALTLRVEVLELKDIKVKNGLMDRFNQGTQCKAFFNSIQFGVEGADEIPASRCPALRVALTGLSHNRERYSPVEEETSAAYSCFIVIKGGQPSETEERLIRAINAVRVDLQYDTTLGGVALDARSTNVTRDRITDKEPFDVAEIEMEVLYLKNPVNGY